MTIDRMTRLLLILIVFSASSTQSADAAKGTVLITGANRGLGLALTQHFIADGYQVIGTARKPSEATELKETGARVVQLDVTDDDSIAAMADLIENVPIDIVVNNAGYIASLERGIASLENTTREQFLNTYNVNTVGPFMVTRALLPNLLLSGSDVKKVVNISSHGGIVNRENVEGIYSYDPTKTALNKITIDLSKDLRSHNIAVIALAPGHNKTRMGGEGGQLEPEFSMGKAHQVIMEITMEDTGTFVGYSGFAIEW